MQAAPTVGWDPVAVNHHLPVAAKLFIVYLCVSASMSLVKFVNVARTLWSGARARATGQEYSHLVHACDHKIRSMKRLSHLTLLLTVLVFSMLLRSDFMGFAEEKYVGWGAFSGSVVEALSIFAAGICVATAIYIVYAFCEGALLRRKTWCCTIFTGTPTGGLPTTRIR